MLNIRCAMGFCCSASLTVVVLFICRGASIEDTDASTPRNQQYNNFEDYLLNVTLEGRLGNGSIPHRSTSDQSEPEDGTETDASQQQQQPKNTSGAAHPVPQTDDSSTPNQEGRVTSDQLLNYFKVVPRQHWSCCMLGILAGNKGFHCRSEFYAERLTPRNYNRAHNSRLPMHGRDAALRRWGYDIMRTFRRCVVDTANEFHRCCYAATVERTELDRVGALFTGGSQQSSNSGSSSRRR